MKIYLAGPMRDLPHYNFQAFENAMLYMESIGHEVISPHEIDIEEGMVTADFTWVPHDPGVKWARAIKRQFVSVQLTPKFSIQAALKRDFAEVLECDTIAFLPGSEHSAGAKAEAFVAQAIGLQFMSVNDFGFGIDELSRRMENEAKYQFNSDRQWVY